MHDHLAMQHVNSNEQVFNDLFSLVMRQCPIAFVELACKHLFAVLKDTMYILGCALVIFKYVEQSDKLVVVDKLSEQGYFPHGGIVNAVGHVLNRYQLVDTYLEHVGLHRNDLARLGVHTLMHFAVGPSAQHTQLCVVTEFGLA